MIENSSIESFFSSPFPSDFGFSFKISQSYNLKELSLEEWNLLSEKAVEKRKLHFFLGRIAAKQALNQIGISNFPVLKGPNNEPIWPKEIVGAIAHTNDVGIACATSKKFSSGVGIDIEKITEKLNWDIVDRICLTQEKKWVTQMPEHKYQRLLMIFSAKESVFKALFPQNHIFFGFHEVELCWDSQKESFSGTLLFHFSNDFPKGYRFSVGCRTNEEYVFTFMSLPVCSTRQVE